MIAPTLTAPGLVLRPLELTDAEALFAAHGDAESHQYWSSPAHKNVEETRAYIEETLAIAGAHVWAITESGGVALGRIGLFVLREGVGEIGVIMRPEASGRGLASKALDLVLAHGFGPLGLHRVAADIDPDNSNSLSLFLRAGFTQEGVLRANWKTHIGMRDSVIMAKLRG
ncbi:MAG TPA: GNAT family N-acetyltransferase [Terricaulis sp.]|nr:GNAT family N-acetyltransferase [Terricaulis sp.]